MSIHGIGAIQALAPGEAWQALLQASLQEGAAAPPAAAESPVEAAVPIGPLAVPGTPTSRGPDATPPLLRQPDAAGTVVPATPALLQPLNLPQGPELRWRVADAPAWRELFDDTGRGDDHGPADEAEPDLPDLATVGDAARAEPVPAWALGLLTRLREAAASPATAPALRPAVQAWCVGLPVLLASPSGLASLQASRDATVWRWRRWPAQWRAARPAAGERWWAVRLGLGPQGRPRTLRELAPARAGSLAPGQVSCELRLSDVAPGIATWTAVLVQAPAAPSLRTLLAERPSLTWLLCNQTLWPLEGP